MNSEYEKEAAPPAKKPKLESSPTLEPLSASEKVSVPGLPYPKSAPICDDDDDDDLFGDLEEEGEDINEAQKDSVADTPPVRAEATLPSSAPTSSIEDIAIPRKPPSTPPKDDIVIPRKSPVKTTAYNSISSLPQPSVAFESKDGRVPGSRYGLPTGVVVPQTIVDNRLLDVEMHAPGSKLLAVLKSLPVNLINDALTEYDDAVEIKGAAAIRNHGAYLYGVVKRYVSVHERALAGEGGILPMGEGNLTSIVQHRLEQLVTSGFCSEQEMNDKVKSKIRMLSEKDALFALDELSSVDRSGILNRYMRGDATKQKQTPHHNHQQNRASQSSSYRPRDRDQYNNSNAYRNSGNHAFRNNNDSNYDSRQQKPWQQQHPPHQNMGGMHRPGGPPPPSNMSQQGGNRTMSHNNNQHGGYGARPSHPPSPQFRPNQQPPPFRNNMQQQPPFVPPPAGFPPGPPPQPHGYPGTGSSNPNGFQLGGPPPPMGGMGGPPPFHNGGNQQQQYNIMQQPNHPHHNSGMPHSQPHGRPQNGMQPGQSFRGPPPPGWQNQQQPGGVDIMGLAEKAASAIQALGGGSGPSNGMNPNYPPSQQQGGYPPYRGGDRGMGQQHPSNMPPQQYAPPGQGFPPQANNHMNGPPPGAMNSNQQQRRRTTATIAELPIAVQYAVQNLTATGALDALPDDGIMGMIFDLPEPLALVTLQKFETLSSAKQSTMRNKTAYLAGVLRRELEKINRR